MLEVVLDEGGDRGQHDRGDRDGEDDVAFQGHVGRQRSDRRRDPGQGDDRQRCRRERRQDRQRGLGHDVGQARRPEVERDRAEAHRDGDREGQVGEPEDDGLGLQLAEIAPEPCRRGDGQRPGDDDRPRLEDADRRPDAAVARSQRDEDPEQAAGRRREDRQARVDEGEGQGRRTEDHQGDRRRVAPRAARQTGDRQPEPDDRAEDEEEAQVFARRQPAPADDQRLAGFDGERRDDGAATARAGRSREPTDVVRAARSPAPRPRT